MHRRIVLASPFIASFLPRNGVVSEEGGGVRGGVSLVIAYDGGGGAGGGCGCGGSRLVGEEEEEDEDERIAFLLRVLHIIDRFSHVLAHLHQQVLVVLQQHVAVVHDREIKTHSMTASAIKHKHQDQYEHEISSLPLHWQAQIRKILGVESPQEALNIVIVPSSFSCSSSSL